MAHPAATRQGFFLGESLLDVSEFKSLLGFRTSWLSMLDLRHNRF